MIGLHPTAGFYAIVIFVIALLTSAACAEENSSVKQEIAGVWITHYQQSHLMIIIHRDHTAHVLWIMKGSHQIGDVRWRPAPNGLIVENVPRFRLWRMPSKDQMRVEMEKLPHEWLGGDLKRFPLAFYMKKQRPFSWPKEIVDRPLPEGWLAPTPGPDFEDRAGKPRRIEE